ncbi:MAG: hypothetical protein M3Z24_15975 [Chloroflexota bacterium]|nr:hypothetical protein [Chloroflexota bacterium]
MFSHLRSSPVQSLLMFVFLCILLGACNTSAPTPTVTSTPAASRTLTPGNGGGTGRIAFTCLSGSTAMICLSTLDGSGLRRLAHLPKGACCPRWSPDGKRIAFSIQSSPPLNDSDIWVMNADGSGAMNLTHDAKQANMEPSWSPDGKQLVFSAAVGNTSELFLINADGSQKRPLLQGLEAENPVWSPDGRTIAFATTKNSNSNTLSDVYSILYLIHPNGSGIKRIQTASGYFGPLVWSPNGKQLLYGHSIFVGNMAQTDAYVMNADGSHVVRLTKSAWSFDATPTSWSPDGSKILFGRVHTIDPQQHLYETALWIMNADGSGQTQLPLKANIEGDADWQP